MLFERKVAALLVLGLVFGGVALLSAGPGVASESGVVQLAADDDSVPEGKGGVVPLGGGGSPTPMCFDTDGGDVPVQHAHAWNGQNVFRDYCDGFLVENLGEYYCNGNQVAVSVHNCDTYFTGHDGYCVMQSAQYGYEGECTFCDETDGGYDPEVAGKVTYPMHTYPYGITTARDICTSSTELSEVYCNGNPDVALASVDCSTYFPGHVGYCQTGYDQYGYQYGRCVYDSCEEYIDPVTGHQCVHLTPPGLGDECQECDGELGVKVPYCHSPDSNQVDWYHYFCWRGCNYDTNECY